MYERKHVQLITKRLTEKRQFIQVILGPRQVGKTTAIQQVMRHLSCDTHYAAADLPAPPQPQWIADQWEIARLKAAGKKIILVLDEIQKIERWSEEVKRLWDEDTRRGIDISLVILGSSSLLVQKGLSESLAGRFELIRFAHWSWEECREAFGMRLDEYVYFGGYPGGAALRHDHLRWQHYIRDSLIETAISKDILMMTKVAKPALLRQLFVLACEYGGQVLSYQKILGQIQDAGNTTTLAHYQHLFEASFLIAGLQKYSGKAVRKRGSSPKWLPLNTGLMTALMNDPLEKTRTDPQLWGRLVEVAVGAHLVNQAQEAGAAIYYWRHVNHEIDYIICRAKSLVAIEVKSGRHKRSVPGFEQFKKEFKTIRNILVGQNGLGLKDLLSMSIDDIFARE
ncbi:MAG: ATP-binding protein [Candidatus Omnitrophota bacterium]